MSKTKRSWRDQIEVRESGIHGRGLFATRAIREGALVGVFEGKKTSKDDMHVLWTESEDGKWVGLRVTNLLMYVNHAADPNTEALGTELYALRRIAADEEITFHYGDEWEDLDA